MNLTRDHNSSKKTWNSVAETKETKNQPNKVESLKELSVHGQQTVVKGWESQRETREVRLRGPELKDTQRQNLEPRAHPSATYKVWSTHPNRRKRSEIRLASVTSGRILSASCYPSAVPASASPGKSSDMQRIRSYFKSAESETEHGGQPSPC